MIFIKVCNIIMLLINRRYLMILRSFKEREHEKTFISIVCLAAEASQTPSSSQAESFLWEESPIQ